MAKSAQQIVIKRYTNRRLYHTRTGQYVSRKSLEEMARRGDDFVVLDTVTGENITHLVLGQIIVAQETVQKEPLLRTVLACYLDFSFLTLTNEKVRKRMTEAGTSTRKLMDEQVQQNIRFFETMLANFIPSRSEGKSRTPDQNGS